MKGPVGAELEQTGLAIPAVILHNELPALRIATPFCPGPNAQVFVLGFGLAESHSPAGRTEGYDRVCPGVGVGEQIQVHHHFQLWLLVAMDNIKHSLFVVLLVLLLVLVVVHLLLQMAVIMVGD
jgi:hypothetical protein